MYIRNQPKHIRNELEKLNKYRKEKNNMINDKTHKKNYQGLKMAWKDTVIFSLLILFTGLYQVRAEPNQKLQTIDFNDVNSGMLLSFDKNTGHYASLELLSSEYQANISGILATVTIRQTFLNPSSEWVKEGVYAYPVNHQAAVYDMKLIIGERIIEGEIHEKKEAEAIFLEAQQAGQTATMVKQYRPNLFTTDVTNIAPQETISVEITYQQTIRYNSGYFDFRIPMAIKARYLPENTDEQLPNSSTTNSDKRLLTITLDAGFNLKELRSLNHNVEINQSGYKHDISLSDNELFDANDFVLRWSPEADDTPKAAYFSEYIDNTEYSLLMLLPPESNEKLTQPRNITYIIDTSGSMNGTALNQAKDALLYAMENLNENTYFNIIDFDSTAKPLFSNSQAATVENINKALTFIDSLDSNGGTEMLGALELAMNTDNTIKNRLNQIIFITDGSVGNEADVFQMIANNIENRRLFTVAIGPAPNNYFMSKAALFGRGTYTHIAELNQVDEAMRELFQKISSPALTDIDVDWKNPIAQSPSLVPDLYLGEPVIITAKLATPQSNFSISGLTGGKSTWDSQVSMKTDGQSNGIARLWARKQVEELTDSIMLDGETEELKEQIIELGLKHKLVTEYTSLVAVDKTPRPEAQNITEQNQQINYPKGSLGWLKKLIIGLFLLAIGFYFSASKPFRKKYHSM